jgi:uncharacterized protein YcbX
VTPSVPPLRHFVARWCDERLTLGGNADSHAAAVESLCEHLPHGVWRADLEARADGEELWQTFRATLTCGPGDEPNGWVLEPTGERPEPPPKAFAVRFPHEKDDAPGDPVEADSAHDAAEKWLAGRLPVAHEGACVQLRVDDVPFVAVKTSRGWCPVQL